MSKTRGYQILRSSQIVEKGVSRASQRLMRAVGLGLGQWRRNRERTLRGDGRRLLERSVRGAFIAAGSALREATWSPGDLFKPLGPKNDPRLVLIRTLLPLSRKG